MNPDRTSACRPTRAAARAADALQERDVDKKEIEGGGSFWHTHIMTQILEKAFDRIAALPEEQQEAIARFLLAEMDSEAEWEEALASSQNELAVLAQQAIAEFKTGRTEPLNLSRDF